MGFAPSEMQVKSTAFDHHGKIPTKHTGEGDDVSPQLSWEQAPAEARSFAVFCHDPDAPLVMAGEGFGTYGFVHWLVYNLPAATRELPEGGCTDGAAGQNNFGSSGYRGPMPPEGHGEHLYYFWVLALDRDLELEPGLTLWQFLERAEPHVIGMSRLVGRYQRG